MHEVAIGVYAEPDSPELANTLRCLEQSVPASTPRCVFPVAKEWCGSPLPECLRQLAAECPAEVYVVMEGGALPMLCWLEEMMEGFRRGTRYRAVGPCTNQAPGAQGGFLRPAG